MAEANVVVVGVGNTLLRDEGLGVHVVRRLQQEGMPDGVTLVEAGVGGFGLLDGLIGTSRAIIVDAAEMGAEAGCVRRFTPEEVVSTGNRGNLSLHQVDLLEVLELGRVIGQSPEAVIIAVQPAIVEFGEGLSDILEARLMQVVEMVRAEIEGFFAK